MNFRLRRFISYYRPYRWTFLAVMLAAGAAAAISLVFPLAIRYITGQILQGDLSIAVPRILRTGALMVLLALVESAVKSYFDYRGHAMGAMMERDMRNELFAHIQQLSHGFFDRQRTGQLMSRITYDLLMLAELFHHGPEDLAVYLVRFVGAFVILLRIDVRLTLAVFAFLPPMTLFAVYFTNRQRLAVARNYERIGEINAQVEDALGGIRTVKSFANEELEAARFADRNEAFLQSRKGIYRAESITYQGVELFVRLITITVAVYGGIRMVGGTLSLPDLLTYLLYVNYLVEPVQRLSFIIGQYQEGLAGFDRFLELLDLAPEIHDAPGAVDPGPLRGEVRLEGVTFRYDHE